MKKGNLKFKTVCHYVVKDLDDFKSSINISPSKHLLNFLDLEWEAKADEILKKLKGFKIRIKEIPS